MRRECYRCHASLGPDIPDPTGWDREALGEPVSHGLCHDCLPLELARMAAETTDPGDDSPGTW